ncbi:MMPL family transporter [Methanomassiliicoccaceae archaeon DOK]|nr:MMPL family transporter [Methanomassiliicoccaceae archaeon DOK]
MAYDRLADAIIKHAKLILVAWIVILLVAAVPAINAFSNMSYDMNEMGIDESESMKGLEIIGTYFPSSDADASALPMLVVGYDDAEEHDQALAIVSALQEKRGEFFVYTDEDGTIHEKISSISAMMDTGVTNDPETGEETIVPGILVLSLSYSSDWTGNVIDDTPVLRDQIAAALADYETENNTEFTLSTYLTGNPAVSYDMENGAMEDISHIDIFTVLMILILVGLFFRSFITSAMPPVTMGVAFAVTMGLIYGLMYFMDIFFITEIMLLVSMMGAGCDYCIFILARYREERRDGKDHHAALHSAIKWAGESITISGASVIIGFGAMSICSFSMISTMGICLALGIIIALLAALTFIPSLLEVVGDRIFWPTKMKEYEEGGKATRGWFAWSSRVGHKYFDISSKFTLKHAKAIAIVAVLVTVPAAYVALESDTSYDMTSSLMTGDSEKGMDLIGEYADQGMIYPNYVLLEYDEPVATVDIAYDITGQPAGYTLTWNDNWLNNQKQALQEMSSKFQEDENITSVLTPYEWSDVIAASGQNVDISMSDLIALASTDPMAALSYLNAAQAVVDYAQQNAYATVAIVLENMFPAMVQEYRANLEAMLAMSGSDITIPEFLKDPIATFMLVTSGGASIDYIVNSNLGYIGGDFANSETGTGNVTYVKVSASTHEAAMSQRSMDSIAYMQNVVNDVTGSMVGVTATWVTGTAVVMYDISEIISGEFTQIEILVVILIIILLFFVMRSYTIPLRSVATILMSICWTLAATHLIFGDEVTWLIPLILLVICLGLGMDYDILLTTRIKENVRAHGMSNDEAIHHAVVHSGSVITICGLIMGGAFGTLMLSSMGMLQQFGFALCFAILCDALIVRTYIVPAVMHLLGDWNWKGPRFLMTKAEREQLDQKKSE